MRTRTQTHMLTYIHIWLICSDIIKFELLRFFLGHLCGQRTTDWPQAVVEG